MHLEDLSAVMAARRAFPCATCTRTPRVSQSFGRMARRFTKLILLGGLHFAHWRTTCGSGSMDPCGRGMAWIGMARPGPAR